MSLDHEVNIVAESHHELERRQSEAACRSRFGTFSECQLCGGPLTPEHAHFKCRACGWRDSCCD